MSTREKILSLVQERRSITAPEISSALGLTRAACRYHLSALEAQGRIERTEEDVPPRRGRPRQRYRLRLQDSPEALAALCAALLDLHPLDEDALQAVAAQLAGPVAAGLPPTQRLNRAVVRMNALGCRARWEAAPAGPRIILRRCPFVSLQEARPQLCRLDLLLLERLAGMALRQVGSRCADRNGCIFEANLFES